MRYSLILLVLAVLLSLGIRFLADPMRQAQMSTNPGHDLQEMTSHDPQLGAALAQADQGNLGNLTAWINRAEPEERYRLGLLLERIICRNDSSPKKDEVDIVVAHRYINRFRAFTNLSTGEVRLDNDLDNILAYALVTGTAHPTPEDISLALTLVPRLRNIPQGDSYDSFIDTVGCVEFMSTNFDEAKDAFAIALRCAGQSHEPHSRQALMVYQRRLEAAVHNALLKAAAAAHPELGTPAYAPLPPDEDAVDPIAVPGSPVSTSASAAALSAPAASAPPAAAPEAPSARTSL